jgi:hypothetical protein
MEMVRWMSRCPYFLFPNRNRSCQNLFHPWFRTSCTAENKKADVAEHPKAFGHVGLLFNVPPGKAELLFIQSSDRRSL